MEEDKILRHWKKDEIMHNMNFFWNNTHYIIGDKIVKVEDDLWMG